MLDLKLGVIAFIVVVAKLSVLNVCVGKTLINIDFRHLNFPSDVHSSSDEIARTRPPAHPEDAASDELPNSAIPEHYVAPTGFDRNRWGDSLPEVAGSSYLRFSFFRHTTDVETVQFYTDRCPGSPQDSNYACFKDLAPHPGKLDAANTHHIILAEYQNPSTSFLSADTGAVFNRAAYQFCVSYLGDAAVRPILSHPGSLRAVVTLCGVRLMFTATARNHSSGVTGETLSSGTVGIEEGDDALIQDNEVRVLNTLKRAFGAPAPLPAHPHRGFDRIAHYTWCDDVVGDVLMNCPAEVMYTFDKGTRNGIVSIVTPIVFGYLYERRARIERGSVPEPVDLYFLLLPRNPPVRLRKAPHIIAEEMEPKDPLDEAQHHVFDVNLPPQPAAERVDINQNQSVEGIQSFSPSRLPQ